MTRTTGRGLLREAHSERFAIPAFNVSNLETIQGVIAAAEAASAPVFLQLSPGALAYAGYDTLLRLVADLAERASAPVVLHLDHCRDPAVVERAIDDGFGSVMYDGSALPLEENVATTRRFASSCGASIPEWLDKLFEGLDDLPAARQLTSAADSAGCDLPSGPSGPGSSVKPVCRPRSGRSRGWR